MNFINKYFVQFSGEILSIQEEFNGSWDSGAVVSAVYHLRGDGEDAGSRRLSYGSVI
jgi:hypothetical protein